MSKSVPITVAHGDGIGPEIMAATLHILKEAGANLEIETIDIGEKVYLAGNTSGIEPSSWDSLRRKRSACLPTLGPAFRITHSWIPSIRSWTS